MALLQRHVSIRTILPNLVTLLAFASGLSAIRFSLEGRFELAVTALAVAAILDGLDGTVARLLKSSSRFGAELDSLSDVVAFGVAPAVTLYLWALEPMERTGWAFAMIYAMAMALRLARFNARLEETDDPKKRLGFLTGVPAPVGCALLMLPLTLEFAGMEGILKPHAEAIAGYLVLVCLLVVSTLPTLSLKKLRLPKALLPAALMVLGVLLAGLFARPWISISVISIGYLVSVPLCLWFFTKRLNKKGWRKKA